MNFQLFSPLSKFSRKFGVGNRVKARAASIDLNNFSLEDLDFSDDHVSKLSSKVMKLDSLTCTGARFRIVNVKDYEFLKKVLLSLAGTKESDLEEQLITNMFGGPQKGFKDPSGRLVVIETTKAVNLFTPVTKQHQTSSQWRSGSSTKRTGIC